ncbi:response regulator receiver domain [Pseudoalteromonas rubra]|uniref:response regulator receiver domain n=1 Tax=Pseudoalteromonas rubra TaxID=43658 RepID=UPI002DC05F13|nr:response regulator receiver domain [Pseudoalteromonas rubra]MEC4090277.1 response regulator receiver domain [Pseudoalteromonas rubra]
MTEQYEAKIVEAFRDNAIRSVLLIDDEYHSYQSAIENKKDISEKIKQLQERYADSCLDDVQGELQELFELNSDIQRSDVASEFVSFFHENKLICDVESNTENLEHDKIRKSDLIVLDYFLKKAGENRAEASLKLLHQLSSSKHMNIVVVYTNEPLNTVWLEIASTLRGTKNDLDLQGLNEHLKNKWLENKDDWLEVWPNFVTDRMKSDYILGVVNERELMEEFNILHGYDSDEAVTQVHIRMLLENSLKELNCNSELFSGREVHGKEKLWLQVGDIFLVLCSKQNNESPEDVWACIKIALLDWKPSVYRVVTSELQNKFEDANLTMEKSLSYLDEDQMAFTWGILKTKPEHRKRITRELLGNIVNEALDVILYEPDFIESVVDTACSVCEKQPKHVTLSKDNEQEHMNFQKEILQLAAKNINSAGIETDDELYHIAHSYNQRLSMSKHFHQYITTGSVVRSADNNWYICVSPSCNTIPNQVTDLGISALKPHRALTFVKLIQVTEVKTALHNAHHSSYIFIRDEQGKYLAFSVIDEIQKLPKLLKVVVKDHDHEQWEPDEVGRDSKRMITFKTNENLEVTQNEVLIYPVAMLKPAYAARFQNIQSHYEGRIGVDFATLNISGSGLD